jgi:hypothetical protein
VRYRTYKNLGPERAMNIRFGSKADICAATGHVCFASEADMCSALAHVCFGPKADVSGLYSSFVERDSVSANSR